jgi:flap endonuclease-1
LREIGVTRDQLIDMSILIGTDFNEGIKGIGPKTALKLLKKYGELDNFPQEVYDKLPDNFEEIRNFYIDPPVTSDYEIKYEKVDESGLIDFLVDNRDFSPDRVRSLIKRLKQSNAQKSLIEYFGEASYA